MLGCAIVEGVLAKQSIWPGGKILAKQLCACRNQSSGYLLKQSKLPGLNSRHSYGTIHRQRGDEACAQQRFAWYGNRTFQIQTRGSSQVGPYDVPMNFPKDVILYKYENPKYFKRLNIFGIIQLLFWAYLSHFVYTELRDIPIPKGQTDDLVWWRKINFGEKTYRIILTSLTFFVGYGILVLCWFHTLKSVRYLILRKGGNHVTFVTYTPFGENRMTTIPLDKMTSKQSREAAKVQLPIKVKGDLMHYLLDMRGEFKQPELFDFTAGLKRPI